MGTALDVAGAVLVVIGALFAFPASVGLLRLPDVLSRMHAATKPQTTGLLFVVVGTALVLRSSVDVWMLVLVGAFQALTAPVTAHLVGRLAHRDGAVRTDLLDVDERDDVDGPSDPSGSSGPSGPSDPAGAGRSA